MIIKDIKSIEGLSVRPFSSLNDAFLCRLSPGALSGLSYKEIYCSPNPLVIQSRSNLTGITIQELERGIMKNWIVIQWEARS